MDAFKILLLALVGVVGMSLIYVATVTGGAEVNIVVTEYGGVSGSDDIDVSYDGKKFTCVIGECCKELGGISSIDLSTGVLECKRGRGAEHCGCTAMVANKEAQALEAFE
jgi:hypothetical protein